MHSLPGEFLHLSFQLQIKTINPDAFFVSKKLIFLLAAFDQNEIIILESLKCLFEFYSLLVDIIKTET